MQNKVLTKNVQLLITSLINQGIHQIVVSPGSRSTPLALLVAEYAGQHPEQLTYTMAVDERDAAFLALGLAKRQGVPVALLATSGTAAANYVPAVSEAFVSHVPLVLLTTDRPEELRDIGAPQMIDQLGLYTGHLKDQVVLTLQDEHADIHEYVSYRTQNLVQQAVTAPAGPVQINLPLRKPLMPDLDTTWADAPVLRYSQPTEVLSADDQAALVTALDGKRVLGIVGPDEEGWDAQAFVDFANAHQVPMITDVLSSLRSTDFGIQGIDALLQTDALPDTLIPDVVLRFGGTPVSGRLLPWLKQHDVSVIQIGTNFIGHDHTRHVGWMIPMGTDAFLASATQAWQGAAGYLKDWGPYTKLTHTVFADDQTANDFWVAEALSQLPVDHQLFLGNSMPIRDFDQVWRPETAVTVQANRGANGIDGTIASAVGMALNGQPTWLALGDLTLFHDMNGLMLAHQTGVDLTIVVTNNQGGGIFSFLPQAKAPAYFEPLFGTPLDLDLAAVATLYHAEYHEVTTQQALADLVTQPTTGLRLIELKTERTQNVQNHHHQIQTLRKVIEEHAKNSESG